jgi:cytochrome P450
MNANFEFKSGYQDSAPAHVPQDLVHDFDHVDPAKFSEDPFGPFLALRDSAPPIFFSRHHGGFWVVQGYDDLKEVLRTPALFSSWPMNIPYVAAWPRKLVPVELDPPDHKKYRALLAPLFTPKAVELMEPMILRSAQELVDRFQGEREIEFLEEFARPFPTVVFMRLMGLPLEDADKLLDIEDRIMRPSHAPEVKIKAGEEIVSYMVQAIESVKQTPANDDELLSYMVHWKDKEQRGLTDEELLDMGFLLFMAGLDTVTSLFGFAFAHLARHHDLQQYLIDNLDNNDVLDCAVEELLRKFPTVNTNRTVLQDCEFKGVQLKRGDRIMLPIVLANHDPKYFENPDRVELDRKDNRQVLFGHGPHKCMGQYLGKRELRIALEVLLRRKPFFSIPEGKRISTYGGGVMGTTTLPLSW